MKILLTGASGLIGSRLVYRLLHEGHDLVLLGRDPSRLKRQFSIPCEIFPWDPENGKIPDEALKQIEAVIHLAGEPIAEKRWTQEVKRRIRNSRVQSTRALVDALIQNGEANPSAFISASGVGYYGDRGNTVLEENTTSGNDFLAEVCKAWEREVCRACEISPKTRCVELRIGMVLAREGGALSKLAPVFEAGLGGPIGSGKQWMSWIHIEDLVSLIVETLKNEKLKGPVNAVSPQPMTNVEFSETLASTLHRRKFLPAPAAALKLAFGELAEVALSSQRAVPTKALEAGFRFLFPHLKETLSDLFPVWYRDSQREFVAHQWVPRKVEDVFPFFSDASNLETITPPWLNFNVVNKSTKTIEDGTQIDYKLRLHGLSLRWRHTHLFAPVKGGTLLTDRVLYKVPFGKLGAIAAGHYVKNDVGKIFEYRKKKIGELFS